MRVIIAGSRHFKDYIFIVDSMRELYTNGHLCDIKTIVSGNCRGVDKLGEKYANRNNLKLVTFPANWKKFGDSAGPLRNAEMADYADALVAFWDGKSKGTENMIDLMQARKKEVYIFTIPEPEPAPKPSDISSLLE